MNNNITNIVVSNYKKDVQFAYNINKDSKIFVYDKENSNKKDLLYGYRG